MAEANKSFVTPSESETRVPTTPVSIGYGHPEYHFVQSISEIQKTLGEINSSIRSLEKTVDSTKSKVDDLIGWKNKILGGAIAIGVTCTLIGFLFSKFSDYITISAPSDHQRPAETQKK